MAATIPGAAQHRLTLRFLDPTLEADYRNKLRPRTLRQLRFSLTSSLVLWPVVGVAGLLLVEDGRSILYGVPALMVFLVLLLALERSTRTLGAVQWLGAVSNTVPGLATVYMLWFEGGFVAVGPISVVVGAVYSFSVLGLPFVLSLVAILPYVTLCAALMGISPDMPMMPFQVLMLWLITAILAAANRAREAAQRRDFYLTRVIADQERELEEEREKQLGQYTLQAKLGQGGMGIVYRAKHTLLRRPTAVKLLSTDDASREDLARFEREVQLTSELSHPNIVAVYDYGHSPLGEFYYAMEYLPGVDLESLIAEWGPMSPERAVPILVQVCDALGAAHHAGLVHRDIKPGNVLLSRIGDRVDVVKVVDFGLVKEVDADSELTSDRALAGTPAYLAPEAIEAPDTVGPASDVYAVGAVGFFLLTGERVFSGATVAEVCGHHVHSEPRPASLLAEGRVPEALDALLLRCLAKNPAARPSAREARDALRALDLRPYRDGEDWWDSFEAARGSAPERAPSGAQALTVDLRGR